MCVYVCVCVCVCVCLHIYTCMYVYIYIYIYICIYMYIYIYSHACECERWRARVAWGEMRTCVGQVTRRVALKGMCSLTKMCSLTVGQVTRGKLVFIAAGNFTTPLSHPLGFKGGETALHA
jgi:hypothetical protein